MKRTRTLPTVVSLALTAFPVLMTIPATGWAQVEEIVVTARKKEEGLQDVPMSVTAFSAAEIERKGINDVTDVAKYTASVQFDESFAQSDTRVVVRGLSPTRGRQNVAVLVDGIDISSEAVTSSGGSLLLNSRLLDVQRIEVVKGPQMVLYGRSAFNGAIQYVSKDPSDEWEYEIATDANVEDQYSITGSVSGPVLGDALGVRLNVAWWDEQGFYKNTITDSYVGSSEGFGLALTTKSDFGDNVSLKFRAEYTDDKGLPSPQAFLRFTSELPTPQTALDIGVANCFPEFVDAISAGVPGNDAALQARTDRLMDPSVQNATGGGGPYCQKLVPTFVGQVPDAEDLQLALGPDPTTPGKDYEGFDRQMYRLSLVADWHVEKGTFTSLTGFTSDDNTEKQDANAYAFPGPGPFLDGNVNSFGFNNAKKTEQLSQEIRFISDLDGPVNVTMGALFWKEDVQNRSSSITAEASGSHCMWISDANLLNPFNIPDGCTGYTETAVAPYQAAATPFRRPSPADRVTKHWSAYGLLDYEMSDTWTLTLEGRYNIESVDVAGPIFYNPAASGGPGGLNPCGIFFRACQPFDDWVAGGNWFADQFDPVAKPELLDTIPNLCWQQDPEGVQRSIDSGPVDENGVPTAQGVDVFNPWCVSSLNKDESWFSPKLTIDWATTDNTLVYFSWSRAQKPGGFSLLTVGSSGLDRDLTEFEPEVMEVWELGGNSTWLDSTLVINGAFFFQDFTDKQALTSALGNDGRLVSKIENAGAAEVFGAEVDITWKPISTFLGGNWAISGAYTWLDTEYTDFTVVSGSGVQAAAAGNCTATAIGTKSLCILDYTGSELENSAPGAFVGSIGYRTGITKTADLFIEADVQWTDRRYTNFTNRAWVNEYWNADVRVGLESDNWNVLVYVNNVLDDDTVRSTGGGPGLGCCFVLGSRIDASATQQVPSAAVMVDLPLFTTGFLPAPRIIGLRASYRFGNN